MSKIVIIGTKSSGKTCYFYGMFHKMQLGVSGFSLRVNDKEAYKKLREATKKLADIRLPIEKRWPSITSTLDTYSLDVLHNLEKLDTLEWIDYPGEHVSVVDDNFIAQLDGADCLFVCVDGELLQGTEDELDDIAADFYNESGMDLCYALQRAEKENKETFPPVCILITKYDAVPEELRTMEIMIRFVQKCFPILFHPGKGKGRMVTICPVTLGKDIAEGGRLRPISVEKPICFATFLMQCAMVGQMKSEVTNKLSELNQKIEKYDSSSWIGKLIKPRPRQLSEEQKQVLLNMIQEHESDLNDLRNEINMLPLFINGEKQEWID